MNPLQLCFMQKLCTKCAGGVVMASRIVPCHTATEVCVLHLQLQTHLVWGLGRFIDSNATLDEPLQVLLDGRNTCGAAALFCSLQTWCQGCCQTIYVLPGMQTEACFYNDCTLHLRFALICEQKLLPNDKTTFDLPAIKTGPAWNLKLTWEIGD